LLTSSSAQSGRSLYFATLSRGCFFCIDGRDHSAEDQRAEFLHEQHSAAVQALIAQAKFACFWVERTEAQKTNMNYAIGDKPMTDEEWAAAFVTKN
jgi:hypothetical protein